MSSYTWSPLSSSATGVTSVNSLTGDITLAAGTGITITPAGNTLTLASTSAGDVTLTAVGAVPNANAASLTNQALTLQPANASFPGVLLAADWTTFNNKQAAGSYLTALTGDGTAAGPGSSALTLATVNSNVGSFGTASSVSAITVNAKGLVTAAASTAIQITESQVTNLTSDLAGKQATGNYITALTGDATASGPGSAALTLATVNSNVGTFVSTTVNAKGLVTAAGNLTGDGTTSGAALTLATVNSNVGSFGSSTSIPSLTVNAKGLVTAASGNVVIAPAGTLTGTTLASNVVTSSLTSVGTITTGVWTGTTLAIANGGTGATSKAAAFDALSPMTTGGDLIYGGASGTGTRLANGTAGQFLKSNGTTAAPSWADAVSPANSSVICDSGNGHGSTNTKIRRFTNSATTGSAITYADSATLGATFTINTAGRYAIMIADRSTTVTSVIGISVNSAQLTTSIQSITTANRLGLFQQGVPANVGAFSTTRYLAVNDVIRSHDDGSCDESTGLCQFSIVYLG
jgi:hypothetical protein